MKFSLSLIVVCFFVFCFSTHAKSKPRELRIGVAQEFENLNPLVSTMLVTSYIYTMTNRRLAVLDEKGKWSAQLATGIPRIETGEVKVMGKGSDKHLKFSWKIKENAKWGDGKPVTCHDLKFGWEVALDPNTSVPDRDSYSQVKSITVDSKNPKICHIVSEPRWDFYKSGLSFLPAHLERPIYEKYKSEPSGYEKNSKYSTDATNPGLYAGPFRVSEIKLGSHVSLVRNEHFYGNKPYFDKVIVLLIPNTGTLEANLRSSTIDMISVIGMSFDQALSFEKKVKKEKLPYRVNFQPSMVFEHIDVNLSNPILSDLRVRKALVHSINRAELTDALFDGRQNPAIHGFTPVDPWYTEDSKKIVLYPYSRRKAKKLLDQAGWKVAKDGYRYKDGKKLSLSLMTTAGNKVRELVQVFLQEQWKKVGVETVLRNQPARVFFGDTLRRRKYPAMGMYAFVSAPENNPRSTVHSAEIPTKENNFSGRNRPGWVNKEVDKIVEQIDVEFDPQKRIELAHRFLYHYTEEVPVIPLYYRSDVSVVPAKLSGYQLPGHAYSATNHIESWTY